MSGNAGEASMRIPILTISAVLVAVQANAQDNRFHWSLSAGPTLAARVRRYGPPVCASGCGDEFTQAGPHIVSAAVHGVFNPGLGVSRRWTGSDLLFRGDLQYSRSSSPVRGVQSAAFF